MPRFQVELYHFLSFTRFVVVITLFPLILQTQALSAAPRSEEMQYYKEEFNARYKYPVYDTLFEKIVWERKVSHLVMEIHRDEYRVTLLMMEEYPFNYKAQNYPIYFAYPTFGEAAKKFEALNLFLRNEGVMAVGLKGSQIIHERILVTPVGSSKARPSLEDEPGKKDTDPILTREDLPHRIPLRNTLPLYK